METFFMAFSWSLFGTYRSFDESLGPHRVLGRVGSRCALDLRDPRRDRSADRVGMILLQKVSARPELHEPAVVKGRGEAFGEGGGDERSRIAREQQLGIARGCERRVRAFENGMQVGGLARDRQLRSEEHTSELQAP